MHIACDELFACIQRARAGSQFAPSPPPPPAVQAIHPQHPSPMALEASLCALEAASFLRQDPMDPATWRFCQVSAFFPMQVVSGWLCLAGKEDEPEHEFAERFQGCMRVQTGRLLPRAVVICIAG